MPKNSQKEIKDIIVYADFLNLSNTHINEIINKLNIDIPQGIDPRVYLYSIKNMLFNNDEVKKIIENRIFAGRTSVKWYRFNYKNISIDEIIENLESAENYYNDMLEANTNNLHFSGKYTCIKKGDNSYIIRVMVPTDIKISGNRIIYDKITTVSNVYTEVNLERKIIEIRTSGRNAEKIIEDIYAPLGFENIVEIDILGRYNGDIEVFKNSLNKGKFIDVTSKPLVNIEITPEINQLLVNVLQSIDNYFLTNNIEKLNEELHNINFNEIISDIELDNIPFTQLLLAGMSTIGMGTREDIQEDLSNQPLNSLLKEYMNNQSGFINFILECDSKSYTIQVGVTTNSINFRTYSTEECIGYIRNMTIG